MGADKASTSLQMDDELVRSATYGDLNAFDELVRRYRYAVTMVAMDILGKRETAEDVAQDAFLTAFKALPQLADPSRFPSWLYAITRNRARRVGVQDAARETSTLSAVDHLLIARSGELGSSHFDRVEVQIEAARIEAELARIAPEFSEPMQLHYQQEWPVERIAQFFSLPLTTVKWRLHRGRELLRQRLEANGR